MPDVEHHEGSTRPPRRPRPPSKFYSKLHNFTAEETSQRGRDKGPKRTRERRHPEEEEEDKKEEEMKVKQRLGFSIKLSDNEMMQDFLAFTGTMPLRKPSKKVQKLADPLFPGLELSKITLSKYKVHEWGRRVDGESQPWMPDHQHYLSDDFLYLFSFLFFAILTKPIGIATCWLSLQSHLIFVQHLNPFVVFFFCQKFCFRRK